LLRFAAGNGARTHTTLTYAYTGTGQAASVGDSINTGQAVTSYTYDNLSRLASATTPNWSMAWTYDEFGNRLTQSGTGTASTMGQTLTYDQTTNQITNTGYTYDAAGNMTNMPSGQVLAYDAMDRLSTVTNGSNVSTMIYDAFGRRIEHDTPDGTHHIYFYDVGGRLLGEYPVPSSWITNCTQSNQCYPNYGWGSPSPGTIKVYLAGQIVGQWTDRLGSTRYTPSGSAFSHYYPYGEEITTGTNNDTYKFAQTYRDSDSGLDYAGHRFYSGGIGRFITGDPTSSASTTSPQSWNGYAYAGGDPANNVDPDGTCYSYVDGDGFINTVGCDISFNVGLPDYGLAMTVAIGMANAIGAVNNSVATSSASSSASAQACWQDTNKIGQTLGSLEQQVDNLAAKAITDPAELAAVDASIATQAGADAIVDSVMVSLGPPHGPYYEGGHFNLVLSQSDLNAAGAPFTSAADQTALTNFESELTNKRYTNALGSYSLHSKYNTQTGDYSVHFDTTNPLDPKPFPGVKLGVHVGVDVGIGNLGHPCLDPAWRGGQHVQ